MDGSDDQDGSAHVAARTDELNRLFARIPPGAAADLQETANHAAVERGVWEEKDGVRWPVPAVLRPRLWTPDQRGYIYDVCREIRRALQHILRMSAEHEPTARLLPLEELESVWFRRYRPARHQPHVAEDSLFCRLDAIVQLEQPGWKSTLVFVENNVVGVGGLTYAPEFEHIVLDYALPSAGHSHDQFHLTPNIDPRGLLIDELALHARELGVPQPARFAFIDDRSLYTQDGEFGRIVAWLRHNGVDAVYADPRELNEDGDGHIIAAGQVVDVIYRFVETRELVGMEEAGFDLSAMRAAFELGIVVPPIAGDLEHKSTFEILTSPPFQHFFSPTQRAIFHAHIPWTRLFFPRRTTGPGGEDLDLVAYTRDHRAELVLKPNRAWGGIGVVIGEEVDDAEWDDAIHEALTRSESYVVQRAASPGRCVLPVIHDDGTVELATRYVASGFFPSRRGLGVFGRYSTSRVVNIHGGGGILPFLVSQP